MTETEAEALPPLRFVIPLDGSREEDRALALLFDGVPNGMLGGLARLLLTRGMGDGRETVESLLLETMREQAARKRLRGRPPGRKKEAAAPPRTPLPVTEPLTQRAAQAPIAESVAPQRASAEPVLAPAPRAVALDGGNARRTVTETPATGRAEDKAEPAARINLGGLVSWNS